jgi:3-oxoacyl-[acyl-carrier protein] reductase
MAAVSIVPTGPVFPDLKGKVVVVTGGSRGIGAAACRLLGSAGARVVAVDHDDDALQDLVDELRWMGSEAIGVVAECADERCVHAVRDHVTAEFGPAQAVLALAGGTTRTRPVVGMTLDEWRSAIEADLTPMFLTVQAFLPGMLAARGGAIVTVGGPPTTQGAVAAFTRELAAEVGASGVRVNSLALGRNPRPDAVAFAALYLASDAAASINAATLAIAGTFLPL